ncbi:MAG: carboxypeptidase regulatory-like domain-containing protein [Acidobacteria bacterium]|nr:carboxypeptidase regulatory-like domain-containing protein [Acidobacteriota bacterium]
MPEAAVKVINVDTNAVFETRTNESGNYQVPFLLPGNYALKVERAGFRTAAREGVRVALNAQVRLDFSLEVGSTVESVTVTSDAPLLATTGADLGQVVTNNYIQNVTVSLTRNILELAKLAPGVMGGGGGYTSNSQKDVTISGGGSTTGRNEFFVDGLPNTVPQSGGNIVFVPSMDSVEEMKVHTTLFDAAYGRTNGGAISITTKGGTNQLHGTTYLFKRWRALNANSWTNNRLGLQRQPVDYYQWGFVVSGPVSIPKLYAGRDKTFFSVALERNANTGTDVRQNRVPTELERQGDYSQTLSRTGTAFAIYDPLSTVVTGSRATRTEFPGAKIPASRLSSIGVNVLKLYPLPNLTVRPQIGAINWNGLSPETTQEKQLSARIDHNLSARQRLFGRVSKLVRDQAPTRAFPAEYREGGGGDLIRRDLWSAGLDDTITFSPTLIGSLRYGFTRRSEFTSKGAFNEIDPAVLGMPQSFIQSQYLSGLPIFRMGENMPMVGSGFRPEANEMHSFLGTFTKLKGAHSIKFGFDWRIAHRNPHALGTAAPGDFTVNAGFTQSDPFTNSTADRSGSAMASILLALPASGALGFTSPQALQNHAVALFAQEDWKAGRKLTLNFGLRYELETPYTERYNRMSYAFDENAKLPVTVPGMDLRGGILFAGIDGNPRRSGQVDGNNFGPRIGFAYSAHPRTVLRGGYGLFYGVQSYNTDFLGSVGAFDASTNYVSSINGGATPFTSLENPFPNGLRQPLGSAVGLMAQAGDSLTFFDLKRLNPYTQQWQFSVQQEVPGQIVVEAAYLGMQSLKQFEGYNLNEKPDKYLPLGTAENTAVPNPFYGILPATSTLGAGPTIPQRRLWVAFPQFNSLTIQGANTGRAIYHALQLRVEKRLSRGLTFLTSYNFSKLIDNNTTSIVNVRKYRSISSMDQPHVLRVAFAYQIPGRIRGGVAAKIANQVVSGWVAGGLFTYAAGRPLSISDTNGRPIRLRDASKSGATSDRLGDQVDPVTRRVLNPYFDTTAFLRLPNQFTISPEVPYWSELREPSAHSLNLSLVKSFPLHERLRLEVRAEATDATNSPNFAAPGTALNNTATFGVINSASGSRQVQGSARITF